MKKKPIYMLFLILLLVVLSLCYFFVNNKEEDVAEEEKTQYYVTEEKHIHLIDTITFTKPEGEYVIKGNHSDTEESKWTLVGYEDVVFDEANMQSIPLTFNHLEAVDKVEGEKAELAEYGLDPAQVTARVKYTDGSEDLVLYLGTKSVDDNYYVKTEGSEDIYLISNLYKERIDFDLNYLVDKSSAEIDENRIMYIDIQREGKEEIEIEYLGDMGELAESLSKYGMQTLTMRKPFDGTLVYPVNVQTTVLQNTSFLKIENLVDLKGDDLSQYGLDNPQMIIKLRDMENSLEIKIGDEYDTNYFYCLFDDKPSVFSILKSSVEPFTNADVMDFMEKFVSLNYRIDLESIQIKDNDKNYTVSFSEPVTESVTENVSEETTQNTKDTRTPYVNGKEVDDAYFTDFYEVLAGITFDSVVQDIDNSQFANPVVTVVYKKLDGSEITIPFYDYNENFYITGIDGEYAKAVHKMTVGLMLDMLEEIAG